MRRDPGAARSGKAQLAQRQATLTVDAVIGELPRLLEVVDRVCRESGVETGMASDIRLAVDEVCSNLIAYGYRGLAPGPIVLRIESHGDRMVIRISDRGHHFDLRSAVPPDLVAPVETRPVGGLGCHLVRSVIDDIDYRIDRNGGNCLTLVRRVTGGPPAASG